jgi:hypothetical protein
VTFQNGRLTGVSSSNHANTTGFFFSPTWEIAGARANGINQAFLDNDYEAAVSLIRDAAGDPCVKGGSESAEIMLGLALCAPERLAGTPLITAWQSLTQAQLRATASWFSGMHDTCE